MVCIWVYEALLGLLNPVDKGLSCLDLQFYLDALNLWWIFVLCEQQISILSYFANHASSPQPLLPPLFSLNIPKKKTGKSHKKCWMKTSPCKDATLKNQLNYNYRWDWRYNTFTPSLHLVPFCLLHTYHKTSTWSLACPQPLMNTALFTAHALDSLPHKNTIHIAILPCSAAIKFQNIHVPFTPTCHTDRCCSCTPLLLNTGQISYLPCSLATTLQPPTTPTVPSWPCTVGQSQT